MTRLVPDAYEDDTVFLYASEVVHREDADTWVLRLDPENCLAGAVGPSISTLRDATPTEKPVDGARLFDGPVLFSAGVLLLVNDRHLLLQRGDDAPTDPGLWTSPAGRCEHDPGTTALKEFYEELAIAVDDTPALVTWGDRTRDHTATYRRTLERVGWDAPEASWRELDAEVPPAFEDQLSTVVTEYGDRTFRDRMLVYFDADANTLELRFVLRITPSSAVREALSFRDGEFDRTVRLFDREQLRRVPRSALVATDAFVVDEILPTVE